MSNSLKRSIGIILGLIAMIFAGRHFLYSYREGNPKWFMLVLVCGMLLILYYSFIGTRSPHDEEDEDYS